MQIGYFHHHLLISDNTFSPPPRLAISPVKILLPTCTIVSGTVYGTTIDTASTSLHLTTAATH